jgi:hypothetical protein
MITIEEVNAAFDVYSEAERRVTYLQDDLTMAEEFMIESRTSFQILDGQYDEQERRKIND